MVRGPGRSELTCHEAAPATPACLKPGEPELAAGGSCWVQPPSQPLSWLPAVLLSAFPVQLPAVSKPSPAESLPMAKHDLSAGEAHEPCSPSDAASPLRGSPETPTLRGACKGVGSSLGSATADVAGCGGCAAAEADADAVAGSGSSRSGMSAQAPSCATASGRRCIALDGTLSACTCHRQI